MGSEEAWTRTAEERAELVAKARAWQGTQREFAEAHGISQPTVSKWLRAAAPTTRPATADLRSDVVQRYGAGAADAAPRSLAVRPQRVPTMLEVVPVATVPSRPVGACLALPGGAELRFDSLPPARWVAELAAELARC